MNYKVSFAMPCRVGFMHTGQLVYVNSLLGSLDFATSAMSKWQQTDVSELTASKILTINRFIDFTKEMTAKKLLLT